MHAGSRQLCMLAINSWPCRLVCTWDERERTAKYGTARHSWAQHGTALRHDTAQHRTALRRAVELVAKLNGAGDTAVCVFVLSAIRSWV